MAQVQEVTYRKPEFIEKSQADLIKAIEDYIIQVKGEGLPEREAVGLSDTQKEAIELLKKGIGAFIKKPIKNPIGKNGLRINYC